MAKLQKSAAVLAASTLFALFFVGGASFAAHASTADFSFESADSTAAFRSASNDSEDDDESNEVDEVDDGDTSKIDKRQRVEIEKKRRELREKFGNKDAIGIPPIVLHPRIEKDEDENEKDDDDDSAATFVPPKKKPSASPSAISNPAVVIEPSVKTNTQSIKGGQLATGSSEGAAVGQIQSVLPTKPTESIAGTQNSSPVGGASTSQNQIAPIDIKTIDFTGKTPTEKFLEAASVSIGAMAAGAIALGATAMIRGRRQQKELNSEYQYSASE